MTCQSLAYLCRHTISEFLRTRQRLNVRVLVAGWNNVENRPLLFWLDHVGALQQSEFASHGQGFSFILSLLDRNNQMNALNSLTIVESFDIINRCWSSVRKRSTSNADKCAVKAVQSSGCVDFGTV